MIEWKNEKNFVDYRFAEKLMSKRVEDIILHQKKELVWFLEHNNLYTLGTSAKTSDFKNNVSIPTYPPKSAGITTKNIIRTPCPVIKTFHMWPFGSPSAFVMYWTPGSISSNLM